MSAPNMPDDQWSRMRDLELRVRNLENGTGILVNTGLTATPGPAAVSQNKGLRVFDASTPPLERLRLGVCDSDATPAAVQGLYGMSAKDNAGVTRAVFGQIPGDYGFALYDGSGVGILDSVGLQQVVKRVGTQGASSTSSAWATSYTSIAATGAAFTLTRPATVLILCQTAFKGTGGTAPFVYGKIGLDSTHLSYPPIPVAVGGAHTPVTLFQLRENMAAGSYTASLWYSMEAAGATTTFDTYGTQIDVYRFGA